MSGEKSVEELADTTVTDAMKKVLTADEAQIVMLYVVAGFKHREIAEIVKNPLARYSGRTTTALKTQKILKGGASVNNKDLKNKLKSEIESITPRVYDNVVQSSYIENPWRKRRKRAQVKRSESRRPPWRAC